ncbi:MAG: hypothetical protein EOO56_27205, partial [Hymenobacter sp.]
TSDKISFAGMHIGVSKEQFCRALHLSPAYELSGEPRPGGVMEFTATVLLDEQAVATGMGLNKKQAEQLAAERALAALGV